MGFFGGHLGQSLGYRGIIPVNFAGAIKGIGGCHKLIVVQSREAVAHMTAKTLLRDSLLHGCQRCCGLGVQPIHSYRLLKIGFCRCQLVGGQPLLAIVQGCD